MLNLEKNLTPKQKEKINREFRVNNSDKLNLFLIFMRTFLRMVREIKSPKVSRMIDG